MLARYLRVKQADEIQVFLVTGAASGIGFELAKMLYSKNATIYIAARSSNRAGEAIKTLQTEIPKSQGRLAPLVVDLADLSSIKPAVQTFLSRETRLDCLMHNAGVMQPPTGSKTKLVRLQTPIGPLHNQG